MADPDPAEEDEPDPLAAVAGPAWPEGELELAFEPDSAEVATDCPDE
jgi:hypothetical protein